MTKKSKLLMILTKKLWMIIYKNTYLINLKNGEEFKKELKLHLQINTKKLLKQKWMFKKKISCISFKES